MDRPPLGPPPQNGKGKARDDDADAPSAPEESDANGGQSLGSRIAASAAALARDAVSAPAGFAADLASLSAGKAGGPSSSAGPSAAQHANAEPSSSPSTSGRLRAGLEARSFREPRDAAAPTAEIQAFLHADPIAANPFVEGASVISTGERHAWASEFLDEGATAAQSEGPANHQPWEQLDDEPHEDHRDGEAVRQLLSDPNFVAMTDVYDVEEPLAADDLFPASLSVEEQYAVEKIRSDLPGAPVHRGVPVDSPMNLLPSLEPRSTYNMDDVLQSTRRDQLLEEWSGVLRSYTDEVWGEMLPAVREVREELEEAKRGGVLNDKALARLRMVLDHVRNRDRDNNI
jgi:hypothetical protein